MGWDYSIEIKDMQFNRPSDVMCCTRMTMMICLWRRSRNWLNSLSLGMSIDTNSDPLMGKEIDMVTEGELKCINFNWSKGIKDLELYIWGTLNKPVGLCMLSNRVDTFNIKSILVLHF